MILKSYIKMQQVFLKKLCKLRLKLKNKREYQIVTEILRKTKAALGDFKESMEFHFKSLGISQRIEDKHSIAQSYWDMGMHQVEVGNIEGALQLFDMFVNYLREIGHLGAKDVANHVEALREIKANLDISIANQYPANDLPTQN